MPSWVRAALFGLTALISIAISSNVGASFGVCALLGLVGGAFGEVFLTAKIKQPIRDLSERRQRQERSYPKFVRWRYAVDTYCAFLMEVVAEERRTEEQRKRKQEEDRKKRDEERKMHEAAKRTKAEYYQTLDGWQFEKEMAALLTRRGYRVKRTGKPGDSGVDLVLRCGGHEIIVQCKAHKTCVGPHAVRDLYGTMRDQRVHEAWLISTNGFTKGAYAFARGKPIRLLKIQDVLFGTIGCREG